MSTSRTISKVRFGREVISKFFLVSLVESWSNRVSFPDMIIYYQSDFEKLKIVGIYLIKIKNSPAAFEIE